MAAYEAGLAGAPCWVRSGGGRRLLPLTRWAGDADGRDAQIVAAVLDGTTAGSTVLDVGCGPGRLTAAIARHGAGVAAAGVDSSPVAVALARARGAHVWHADVLQSLPMGVGQWDRILLADGNLGIGGDPVALLRRLRPLLTPGGRIVADVRRGGGLIRAPAWIESVDADGTLLGGAVPWAWVGADSAQWLGAQAGLTLRALRRFARGRIAVWERA